MTAHSYDTPRPTRTRGSAIVLAMAVTVALAITMAAAAGTAPAKPKPGFLPGTWIGKGTISGTSTDGPFTVHFSGGIAFTLRVDASLRSKGTGTWQLDMLGSQDGPSEDAIDSTMQGRAAITLKGSGRNVSFSGLQRVVGEIRTAGTARPISFSRPLTGALTTSRAGKCKVSGVTRMPDGVKLVWSAVLKGSGTCRT